MPELLIMGDALLPAEKEDRICEDCNYCQACSKSRCRVCRSGKKMKTSPGLAKGFTYEEYQKWKLEKEYCKKGSINNAVCVEL